MTTFNDITQDPDWQRQEISKLTDEELQAAIDAIEEEGRQHFADHYTFCGNAVIGYWNEEVYPKLQPYHDEQDRRRMKNRIAMQSENKNRKETPKDIDS